jgi:hypothetical protein
MTALDKAILREQKKQHDSYKITDKRLQEEIAVLKQDLATVQTQMMKNRKQTESPEADTDERNVLLKGTRRKLSKLLKDHEKDAVEQRLYWEQQNQEMEAQLEKVEQDWVFERTELLETLGFPKHHDKHLVQEPAALIGDEKGSGSARTELESPKLLEKTKNSDITPENKAGTLDIMERQPGVSKLLDGAKDVGLNIEPVAESAFLESPSDSLVGQPLANVDSNHLLANPTVEATPIQTVTTGEPELVV